MHLVCISEPIQACIIHFISMQKVLIMDSVIAFIAMIDSAQTIIRMSLQDISPVCIPKIKIALPGCTWPKPYLDAMRTLTYKK